MRLGLVTNSIDSFRPELCPDLIANRDCCTQERLSLLACLQSTYLGTSLVRKMPSQLSARDLESIPRR